MSNNENELQEGDIELEPEFVMMSEEDYDELCMDVAFWSATSEMLSEVLEKNGIQVVISEDEIWERVRLTEGGTTDLN